MGHLLLKQLWKLKKVIGFLEFSLKARGVPGTITGVTEGFAKLAKITKCAVLPIGIVGTQEARHLPFTGHVVVKIGKPITYNRDPEVVRQEWIRQIQELTGFEYVEPQENVGAGDEQRA